MRFASYNKKEWRCVRKLTVGGMILGTVVSLSVVFQSAYAQTRDKGPWWPSAQWGRDDQAGGSNWITPEKIIEALRLVKTGKVYELGQIYSASMPL